jgi:hypothetical protein
MNHFADVPQVCNGALGLSLFGVVIIFHVHRMSTAVYTFHLNAPTALVNNHTSAPADGTNLKFNILHGKLLI